MYQTENMYITSDLKMSEVIINNPYLSVILENFSIRLPVKDKSVGEVCSENDVKTDIFLLIANLYNGFNHKPFHSLTHEDIKTIVLYLKNTHQYYLKEVFPEILQVLRQLADRNKYQEMNMVDGFFAGYFEEVKEHLDYEDQVVFPYVYKLYDRIGINDRQTIDSQYSVKEYQDHHNDIEEKLNDLKNILIKYLPQKDDQPHRRKLLIRLSEIEYDISVHAKIEELILIPLVESMELELFKKK